MEYGTWKFRLLQSIRKLPGSDDHVFSMLSFLAQYNEIVQIEGLSEMITGLVYRIMMSGESFGIERNMTVALLLRDLGLSQRIVYERCCILAKKARRHLELDRDLPFKYYVAYRQDDCFNPTASVLLSLVSYAADFDNEQYFPMIEQDCWKYHPDGSPELFRALLNRRARRGEHEIVNKMTTHLLQDRTIDSIRVLHPLLHSEALRRGPAGVEDRLSKAQREHSLKPSVTTMNILLHAYCRAQDYDGAMTCVARLFAQDLKPDTYTIGTMMGLCAARGDSIYAKSLVQYATENSIALSMPIYESLVLANINDGNLGLARAIAQEVTSGDPKATTRLWAQLVASLAAQGDYYLTERVVQEMRSLKVPFDGDIYAALMRLFVARSELGSALKILHQTLPRMGLRPISIHYAIAMDGCAREGKFSSGLKLQAEMLDRGIKPTPSVRAALLKLQAFSAARSQRSDGVHHPGVRYDIAEELLQEYLDDPDISVQTRKGPRTLLRRSGAFEQLSVAYFDALLLMYGRNRAVDSIRVLVGKHQEKMRPMSASGNAGETIPLLILLNLLRLSDERRDHTLVTHFWNLSVSTALDHFAPYPRPKTYSSMPPDYEYLQHNLKPPESRRSIPAMHRRVLARHLDIYIRSLAGQKNFSGLPTILKEYISRGFALDYLNWSLYIEVLAMNGFVREAFTLCEQNLMKHKWRGWDLHESDKRARFNVQTGRKETGQEFISTKFTTMRPLRYEGVGLLHVTYRTMLRLSKVLFQLRKAAGRRMSRKELFGGSRENFFDVRADTWRAESGVDFESEEVIADLESEDHQDGLPGLHGKSHDEQVESQFDVLRMNPLDDLQVSSMIVESGDHMPDFEPAANVSHGFWYSPAQPDKPTSARDPLDEIQSVSPPAYSSHERSTEDLLSQPTSDQSRSEDKSFSDDSAKFDPPFGDTTQSDPMFLLQKLRTIAPETLEALQWIPRASMPDFGDEKDTVSAKARHVLGRNGVDSGRVGMLNQAGKEDIKWIRRLRSGPMEERFGERRKPWRSNEFLERQRVQSAKVKRNYEREARQLEGEQWDKEGDEVGQNAFDTGSDESEGLEMPQITDEDDVDDMDVGLDPAPGFEKSENSGGWVRQDSDKESTPE